MGLISPRDIADLTQMATQLAAQTMQTNSELLNKPGGDDVRPLSLNARPSEIFSQGLTNIMQPAKQHLSKALQQPATSFFTSSSNGLAPGTGSSSNSAMNIDSNTIEHLQPLKEPVGSAQGEPLSLFSAPTKIPKTVGSTVTGNGNDHHVLAAGDTLLKIANSFLGTGTSTNNGYYSYGNEYDVDGLRRNDVSPSQGSDGLSKGITNVVRLFNSGMQSAKGERAVDKPNFERGNNIFGLGRSRFGSNSNSDVETGSNGNGVSNKLLPTLRQFFPGANKNFGFRSGEGCLPFIGEFMKMAYGNCVKQADEKTWDTWGKEITNALMGGKIDLLRASKETCKKGAEREQCGQLRKAVSECDILGSIQMASNLQRSVSRCDEISGILDQNPTTIMSQMNGLINGEVAQGFLNNFLGG